MVLWSCENFCWTLGWTSASSLTFIQTLCLSSWQTYVAYKTRHDLNTWQVGTSLILMCIRSCVCYCSMLFSCTSLVRCRTEPSAAEYFYYFCIVSHIVNKWLANRSHLDLCLLPNWTWTPTTGDPDVIWLKGLSVLRTTIGGLGGILHRQLRKWPLKVSRKPFDIQYQNFCNWQF